MDKERVIGPIAAQMSAVVKGQVLIRKKDNDYEKSKKTEEHLCELIKFFGVISKCRLSE